MINKKLGKMEVSKGFIYIPIESRKELIGELQTPFETFVKCRTYENLIIMG